MCVCVCVCVCACARVCMRVCVRMYDVRAYGRACVCVMYLQHTIIIFDPG